MKKPRLLILTNEGKVGDSAGQINGYEVLVESSELGSVRAISHKESFEVIPAIDRVLSAVSSLDYDVVLIWSPGLFPATEDQFAKIIQAINGRPILYWEGDPWGRRNQKKPVTPQMGWWMSNSEIVFSTVGEPHVSTFKDLGARSILHIAHTYCHLNFANEEKCPPILKEFYDEVDFSMIASNTARIPGITGSPGALRRWELVTRLHFDSLHSSRLYGNRWPKGWSEGFLNYEFQAKEIRRSRISLNWDNFDDYEDYASDRLPISLIAGRPHVTTKHPGMTWAPGEDLGLFQEKSPKKVMQRAKELMAMDPDVTWKLGLEAHAWAKNRISHREAARYVISCIFDHVKKPPEDPWGKLPGPW